MGIRANRFVYDCLRDLTGSADMNVDGSLGPRVFSYVSPRTSVLLERVTIMVVGKAMTCEDFGGLGHPLANGVFILVADDNGSELMEFPTIKCNLDWFGVSGVTWPVQNKALDAQPIVWQFPKPIQLEAGDSFRFVINDDLSEVERFRANIQGVKP